MIPQVANGLTRRYGEGTDSDGTDTMITHSLCGEGFAASEDGTGRGTPLVPVAIQERAVSENLDNGPGGKGFQAVAFDMRGREGGAMLEGPHDTASMRAASGGSSRSYVSITMQVRRLTPKECERLQGFQDDHTKIPYRNKPADKCPDGPRYKALGNSMAIPVMRWIGERINEITQKM